MALDPVPYAIGNGTAVLSGDTMRAAFYASMGGREGVTEVGDFKVTQTPTAGTNIRVAAGSAALKNKYSGGSGQMYHVRAGSVTDKAVAATGGSAATKYVCLTISDPQYGGSGSGASGPYDDIEILTALPTGRPYLHLATINQPASTSTITNAMITDARKVAKPNKQPEMRTLSVTSGNGGILDDAGTYPNNGETFPVSTETAWGEIPIPEWATWMKIIMRWSGIRVGSGSNAYGLLWVQVAPTANPDNVKTQAVSYDTSGSTNTYRAGFEVADTIRVPAGLRGTSQKFYPRGNRNAGASAPFLELDGGSNLSLQVEFLEVAD